ncbi:MAG: hypothetical protein WBN96_04895 [Gammaproteobacteria bacterium]
MDFSFNANHFRDLFKAAAEDHLHTQKAQAGDDVNASQNIVPAMLQAIDVMQRADTDFATRGRQAEAEPPLRAEEITEIGDYALSLLEALVSNEEDVSGHQNRELMRLAIPVCVWVADHGGRLQHIELAVNSLAGYANELKDMLHLAELCRVMAKIIDAVTDDIRRDLEQTNPMRPWRILNLNYGIVATRSHDTDLMEQAYAALIKNLPQDARQFFREGMQQMDIIGYPEDVRAVVQKYDQLWGAQSTLH